jgi:thiazole tautomerase (transcriptional regulator TenI)
MAILTAALPRVHAVTNDEIVHDPDFLARATSIMRALGDRGAVHLRAHRISGSRLFELATALVAAQNETGCWLIVNDRVDIAMAVGASAIQLTSASLPVADARLLSPDARIGASVHNAAEAQTAAREGAEWAVAGNVFPTASHIGRNGKGAQFLREIAAAGIPVIAIGGVRAEHVGELREAGAYGVAMIRGIWGADNAEQAASRYLSIYDVHGGA